MNIKLYDGKIRCVLDIGGMGQWSTVVMSHKRGGMVGSKMIKKRQGIKTFIQSITNHHTLPYCSIHINITPFQPLLHNSTPYPSTATKTINTSKSSLGPKSQISSKLMQCNNVFYFHFIEFWSRVDKKMIREGGGEG